MKITLKELKETRACLKIIIEKMSVEGCDALLKENEELIAITAKINLKKEEATQS